MRRSLLLILPLLVIVGVAGGLPGPAQDKPLPPREAPLRMTLPDGFRATLFAGEPDVVQPIAFAFDARGRLWVAECYSYPKWLRDGKEEIAVRLRLDPALDATSFAWGRDALELLPDLREVHTTPISWFQYVFVTTYSIVSAWIWSSGTGRSAITTARVSGTVSQA